MSLPRNSLSLRRLPDGSVSVNGPPTDPRPYIRSSIICAADGGSAARTGEPPNKDAMTNSTHALGPAMVSPGSDSEANSGAGGRCQNPPRHLALRFLGEIQPAAMHGNHDIGIQLGDLADDLREIIRRRRPEVEAAHDRVNPLDPRYFHRLAHRIHDTD